MFRFELAPARFLSTNEQKKREKTKKDKKQQDKVEAASSSVLEEVWCRNRPRSKGHWFRKRPSHRPVVSERKEAWRRNLPFQGPFGRPLALVPSVPEVLGFGAIRSERGGVLELSVSKVLGFRLGVRHMFHRPW